MTHKKKKRGIVGSAFRGVQKGVALPAIKGFQRFTETVTGREGPFTEEQFREAEHQLDFKRKGEGGGILKDPDVRKAAAVTGAALGGAAVAGALGGPGAILARIAPNFARLIGGEAAGRGATATITKTATTISRAPVTVTAQRAFQVGQKGVSAAATTLQRLIQTSGQVGVRNLLKAGAAQALRHKGAIAALSLQQSIITWFAADNILTQANIFSRDLATNVRFGNISVGTAREGLDEAQRDINAARRFINISTAINPILIPFRKILKIGVASTQRSVDLQKTLIGI